MTSINHKTLFWMLVSLLGYSTVATAYQPEANHVEDIAKHQAEVARQTSGISPTSYNLN